MIHTSRQLKDLIRNLAKRAGIEAHILLRRYMMERLLERISISQYSECFVLKGGMLISSLLGVDLRATMDIDTTVKGLPATQAEMDRIINDVISIPVEDGVSFQVKSIDRIMDDADYSGLRVSMVAYFDGSITPLKIDISTGDAITPREMQYQYRLMFEDRSIPLLVYPIETVLAEKIETLISRSTANSRMRDFYDMYLLQSVYQREIDPNTLASALRATASRRRSISLLGNAESVLAEIERSKDMKLQWERFQQKHDYAKGYSWARIISSVRRLCISAGLPVKNHQLYSPDIPLNDRIAAAVEEADRRNADRATASREHKPPSHER